MARRTRRRPGVVWLPLSTENRLVTGAVDNETTSYGQYAVADAGANPGDATTALFPVVNDQPQLMSSPLSSLADVEGSAYRLRRIVGKIYVEFDHQAAANANTTTCHGFLVTVGFIVIEVEATLNFLPKSATATDYSLVSLKNMRDPWIWRRSWLIGFDNAPNAGGESVDGRFSILPENNIVYGAGVMDGPHIDAKTARVVKDDQRLAMVVTLVRQCSSNPAGGAVNPAVIIITTDLRVLASLRKSSGNRHNASR